MELSRNCLTEMKNLKREEMGRKTVVDSLLIELRPRLSLGNVLLQTNRTISKVEFSAESSQVFLSLLGDGWAEVIVLSAPNSFTFVPSGFRIDDNSIAFNIVFGPLDKRLGSVAAEVLKVTQGGVTQKSKDEFSVPDFPCQPKCRICDFSVWEEWWKFDRVLPLPLTPLEEVIGEWFCHGHSDAHKFEKRPTDCYYDNLSTFFYLNNSAQGVVLCKKCSAWIGMVDKYSMCRLWGCTVKWECSDGSSWANLPDSPLRAFLEAVKQAATEEGHLKPILKLSIQTQYSNKEMHWLVLFILNGHLKLLLSPSEVGGLEGDDVLKEDEESVRKVDGWYALMSDILPEGDIKQVLDYGKSHYKELPFKVNLHSKLMRKVLFKEEKGVSSIKDVLNNADVSLKVAAPMFKAGLDHLLATNQLLPQRERLSDSFSVSYLEF